MHILDAAFGAAFVLLIMYVIYLRGAREILLKMNRVLSAEQAKSDESLRALATKLQGLTQPQVIRMSEDQVLQMASLINNKLRLMYEAEQAAALNKLN